MFRIQYGKHIVIDSSLNQLFIFKNADVALKDVKPYFMTSRSRRAKSLFEMSSESSVGRGCIEFEMFLFRALHARETTSVAIPEMASRLAPNTARLNILLIPPAQRSHKARWTGQIDNFFSC